LAEIFSEAGYQVSSAGSGSETIEMLTRDAFDLILCDIDVPRKSGTEILRMVRALNQKARIVVVTSSGGFASRGSLKSEGVFKVLNKPLRKATLLEAAREALRRSPSRRKKEVAKP